MSVFLFLFCRLIKFAECGLESKYYLAAQKPDLGFQLCGGHSLLTLTSSPTFVPQIINRT